MPEKHKIATIEGHCFSGKTTIINKLRSNYQIEIIEEYVDYAGGADFFPKFPPRSIEEAKSSIKYFVDLEKKRSHDAIEKSIKSGLPVIMDRSPLSCIVFQKVANSQVKDIDDIYSYSCEAFYTEFEKGNIVFPSVIVYAEPPNIEIFKKRVLQRGRVPIEFLNTPETFIQMQKWYKQFLSEHLTSNNGMILQTLEGQVDLLAFMVYEFLSNANFTGDYSSFFLKNTKQTNLN